MRSAEWVLPPLGAACSAGPMVPTAEAVGYCQTQIGASANQQRRAGDAAYSTVAIGPARSRAT